MREKCKEILRRMAEIGGYHNVASPEYVDSWSDADCEYFAANYGVWLEE
jgi:hypothetical protein